MSSPTMILFAGGGTGGHINPGLAIAERVADIDPDARCAFVCSQRPLDAAILGEAGATFIPVPAAPPSMRPAAALRFLHGYRKSVRIVRNALTDQRTTQVVALGGFVAAPAVTAAAREHLPITLLNLDAPPGKANRLMARRCGSILSAVPLPMCPTFADEIVGLPIRRLALAPAGAAACRSQLHLQPDRPTLLVTGASQGATSINRFVTALASENPDAFDGWQVLHLSGAADESMVGAAYGDAGIQAHVLPFLHEMGLAWGAADLAVSRAGASSVAEAAANGVPSVFLPYPWHRDEHQRHNAMPLVRRRAAIVERDHIEPDANVRHVGPILLDLMSHEDRRQSMRDALRADPPDDAAATIARRLLGETA